MTDLTLLVLLCLAPFCWDNKTPFRRNTGAWLMFACLVLLFGLRHYSVGTDSFNYAFRYETLTDLEPFEKGFRWLIYALHAVCERYTFLFISLAALLWGGLIHFYRKYTALYWLPVFLFCALGGVNSVANNGMRQGAAIALFLTAVPCALQKQWIRYYIWAALAFLFHRSSIFIFPLYFLMQFRFRRRILIPVFLIFCVILAFAEPITHALFSDYTRYLMEVEQISGGKLVQLALVSCFGLFPFYHHYRTLGKNPPVKSMLLWMTVLYLLCSWGMYIFDAGGALSRVAWYFFPFVPLNFALYISEQPPKTKWLMLIGVIGLIFCYRLGVYYLSDTVSQADIIYYYKFFWQ